MLNIFVKGDKVRTILPNRKGEHLEGIVRLVLPTGTVLAETERGHHLVCSEDEIEIVKNEKGN